MDSDHQQQSHEGEFGEGNWTDIGHYGSGNTHSTPIHEYSGFQFGSTPVMPIEPAYNMSIPPPYTSHQQLQPLIMPQWPSMLSSQATTYSATPITSASTGTPISATSTSSALSNPIPTPTTATSTGSTPRRTLTDADRRAMCVYHQQHPTVKQTEIGAMFGVERSTVSKVLRLKDKFLSQDDESQSPVKKSKSKFPDIDRALSNWVKSEQRHNRTISDATIREKARKFVTTIGNDELQEKINSAAWLERFKVKNNIGTTRHKKSPSDHINEVDPITLINSNSTSSSHSPIEISPESPSGIDSPPMSPRGEHSSKGESNESFFDFSDRHRHIQTTYSDALPSLPASATSPTSPFWPETSGSGAYAAIGASTRLQMPGGPPVLRPRSLTVPNLSLEPGALLNSVTSDEVTPKYSDRAMSFDLFDSPLEENPGAINPLATMKRNNSVPNVKTDRLNMQPPPIPPMPKYEDNSPVTPTQDDARKALEVVMAFFQNQPGLSVDPQDFMTIGKLMEKLKLAQSPVSGPLPGGLHRIEEHDSPRVSKKRSIRSL